MFQENSYPTSIYCIIATEFCERFSFCGLRTILSIYLRNELLFSESYATIIYHVFIMLCYILPVVGAIFADSLFGRYRTIMHFSYVYLIGNVLMCIGAIPVIEMSSIALSAVGLLLISVGSGGLKPCVAAFGGDQFKLPDQKQLLGHFFSIFYFSINLGGFVGMIITPILRKWVPCFGEETCYALGFGFPAALMLLGMLIFIMGKSFYKLKSPKENVMLNFLKCTTYALSHRRKRRLQPRRYPHCLDVANQKYGSKLVYDIKIVLAVLCLYIPLPIFWSLFDQQGSRWTFQVWQTCFDRDYLSKASHMDGYVLGIQIVPDQMQVVNPAMVLIMIPIFDKVINPCFAKRQILENPLHRMTIGGLFAGGAFLCAGILELVLETTYPRQPERRHASVNVINTLPCAVQVRLPVVGVAHKLRSGQLYQYEDIVCTANYTEYELRVRAPQGCARADARAHRLTVVALERQTDTVVIGLNTKHEIESYTTEPVDFQKSLSGKPRLRIVYVKNSYKIHNVTVTLRSPSGFEDVYFVGDTENGKSSHLSDSAYMELSHGMYDCRVRSNEINILHEETLHFAIGGVYSIIIREGIDGLDFFKLYTMSAPNTINVMWLLPQYFLISVAEILFGVAGLEFSFTQAPKSMKTVTIAGWYLTVAFGNLLVILVTEAHLFESQAYEFLLFAGIMVADMMVFIEMASHYRFVQLEADSSAFIFPSGNSN